MTAQASFLEEEVLESHQQGQLSSGICREAVDMMAMSCGLRGQRGPVQILALLFTLWVTLGELLSFSLLDQKSPTARPRTGTPVRSVAVFDWNKVHSECRTPESS